MNDYERERITKAQEDQLITPPDDPIICSECDAEISGTYYEDSQSLYGDIYCVDCWKEHLDKIETDSRRER